MQEKDQKYCLVCGMPSPDNYWCKHCTNSYKRVRRRAQHMPFAPDVKLKIKPLTIEYIYKEGLLYIWDAKWFNKDGVLTWTSEIEDLVRDHPESVKELREYKITKYYKNTPS